MPRCEMRASKLSKAVEISWLRRETKGASETARPRDPLDVLRYSNVVLIEIYLHLEGGQATVERWRFSLGETRDEGKTARCYRLQPRWSTLARET
jgi:hypothetical protein